MCVCMWRKRLKNQLIQSEEFNVGESRRLHFSFNKLSLRLRKDDIECR